MAAPEEEEKEPQLLIPDIEEARKFLRKKFQREKGDPICLVCFFRASEIMFRVVYTRHQKRDVEELIRKLWTDWHQHNKKVAVKGRRKVLRHDPQYVCQECGNFNTLAVTDLKFT